MRTRRSPISACFTSLLALCLPLMAHSADVSISADEYVRKADAIRNPAEEYKMTLVVKTPDAESTFEVFLKSQDKTVIVTKSPAKDRGRNMLMLDRDFYAFIPNLKRAVRLSLAQKLSGQVANGDISRTRWYGDYKAQVGRHTQNVVELSLDAAKTNLTYAKILLYLDAHNARPLRAKYLSTDGKTVLKTASFEEYRVLAGQERPSLIRIQDAGQTSTLKIISMEKTSLADSFFTEHNLENLR